jgi:hypothetical protein
MRLNKWLVIAVCAAITTSCGNNSTADTTTTDTSTQVTNNTETSTPVNTSTTIVVPEATKTTFTTKYPNATNVTWNRYQPVDYIEWDWSGWPTLDTSDYVVSYNWDGTEYWSWYDENNNWIGTVSPVKDHASLPAAVNKTVQAQFPGYTIVNVDKENDKNRTAYEIELEKGTDKAKVLIAENGSVLKKKTMTDGQKTKEKPAG